MDNPNDRRPPAAPDVRPPHADAPPSDGKPPAAPPAGVAAAPPESRPAAPPGVPHPAPAPPPAPTPPSHRRRNLLILGGAAVGLAGAAWFLVPWLVLMLTTVSTDDAYVDGHVTAVAPRVAGQVVKVLVDNNNRVRQGDIPAFGARTAGLLVSPQGPAPLLAASLIVPGIAGDLLVQLDTDPYQILVDQKQAALATARADLALAQAQARANVGLTRGNRFKLQHAIEDVDNQVALLRANVAALKTYQAKLTQAKADYDPCAKEEAKTPGVISQQDLDKYQAAFLVAQAQVTQALETVYQVRAGLGLPTKPEKGDDLTQVPPDLDQTYSAVRQAEGELLQSAAPLGIVAPSYDLTPKQLVEDFFKQYPEANGDIDRIYALILPNVPAVKEAETKVEAARQDLAEAELNLSYCYVFAAIDGQVTNRNVNPGDHVQVGQNLMAVHSLTEIWIDCNFKETQLADLRIGQRVRCDVDMYGGRRTFEGRITGFSYGTGSTLALLPPENATGNFVKIVQRLPVRVELTNYDPEKTPLFAGLSVEPYVYYKEPATGPHAGDVLQPMAPP